MVKSLAICHPLINPWTWVEIILKTTHLFILLSLPCGSPPEEGLSSSPPSALSAITVGSCTEQSSDSFLEEVLFFFLEAGFVGFSC
jgi:hypothetical protein